jgi:hypothetical protein
MQTGARIGAQPNDVAGVRGNFRLVQDDIKHQAAVYHATIARHDVQ